MRKRLTNKRASEEVLYPGNINFPERQFVDQKKYENYDELVGFDLPNMEKAWQKDSRNEIGMPNAIVASTRAAASSAVKLAIYLLGDKATESMIKEQASSFMRLGGKEIVASLQRFEKVAQMYQEEDAIEEEVKKAKKSEEEVTEEDTKEAKKSEEEVTEEDTKEAKKSEEEVTEEDTKEAKKSEEEVTEEVAEEDTKEAKKSEEDTKEDTKEAGENDGIIFEEAGEETDDATIASLANLYPTKEGIKSVASVAKSTKTASKKVATKNVEDLSSIWGTAEDISKLL